MSEKNDEIKNTYAGMSSNSSRSKSNAYLNLIDVGDDPSTKQQTHQERMYQFNSLPKNRLIQQAINEIATITRRPVVCPSNPDND